MLALHDQRGQILNHASTADARPDLRVSREESSTWRGVRALVGLSLGALTLTPVYRLLDDPGTGPFGEGTVRIAASNLSATWLGIAVTLGLGTVLAILVPRERLIRALAPLKRGATEVPLGWWVLGLSSISTALALWASLGLFQGLPTLVDGMTSVMHARFMAAGQAAGALPDPAAAWMIPNSVLTEGGWVSQYPPMHSLLLSLGLRAGVPWLVNPLLTGVLTACATLVAHHLLGRNAPPARLGSLFIACSPFVVFLGGGYLSHVSAAAFAAFTLYAALRARDGAWLWSVAAGAGMGALVTSRPWTGMVLGTAFTLGLWLAAAIRDPTRHLGRLPRRLAGATLGGAPFAIAWGVYNSRFFGHPLRMGYSAAYGPSHDLGFHVDPWGNVYGPTEGLGYIAANLLALGFHALETFLPIVPLVAVLRGCFSRRSAWSPSPREGEAEADRRLRPAHRDAESRRCGTWRYGASSPPSRASRSSRRAAPRAINGLPRRSNASRLPSPRAPTPHWSSCTGAGASASQRDSRPKGWGWIRSRPRSDATTRADCIAGRLFGSEPRLRARSPRSSTFVLCSGCPRLWCR